MLSCGDALFTGSRFFFPFFRGGGGGGVIWVNNMHYYISDRGVCEANSPANTHIHTLVCVCAWVRACVCVCACISPKPDAKANRQWIQVGLMFTHHKKGLLSSIFPWSSIAQSVWERAYCLLATWCLRLPSFESCIQQRKTTCLISIHRLLPCASVSKIDSKHVCTYVCTYVYIYIYIYIYIYSCVYHIFNVD